MFEDATFESAGRIRTRSRRWMIAAFALNASIVLAFILIPLFNLEALPRQWMSTLITVPLAPAQQPAPKPAQAAPRPANTVRLDLYAAPRIIPDRIYVPTGPEPPLISSNPDPGSGVPGGYDGPGFQSQTPRPVVHPETNIRMRVSTMVEDGLLIHKTIPVYPPIARAVGAHGTVVLAATISKSGEIENLRVVSGPPLLQQAALDAVRTWRYRPYLLDGQPVEVETTVDVIFTLGQ